MPEKSHVMEDGFDLLGVEPLAWCSAGSPTSDARRVVPHVVVRVIVCCLLAAILPALTPFRAEASDTRTGEQVQILLLHPDDLHAREVELADKATRDALFAALPQPIEIHSEGFETLRLTGARLQEAAFVEALLQKYASHPPNLIVAHAEMFAVVLRHRAELWPRTPLMLVDVAEQRILAGEVPPDIPKVTVDVDFAGTIGIAQRMQPAARRIAVIFGASEHDRYWGRHALRILDSYRDRIEIQTTDDRSLEETLRAVRDIGRDSIVLYISVTLDQAGRSYLTTEVAQQIAAASNAPVYSPYGSLIGLGVVGGSTTHSSEAKSLAIGEIARRLLDGGPASEIPKPRPAQPVCSIDWRAVQHWGLDASRIPPGCTILFREQSFLAKHRYDAIASAILLCLLAPLAAAFWYQRGLGKRAQAEVRKQHAELARAGRLASAGQLTASITHELNQSLTAILSNAEAGAVLLSQKNPPLQEIKQIFDDIGADDIRAAEVIRRLRGLLSKQVIERQIIVFQDLIMETVKMVEPVVKSQQVSISLQLCDAAATLEGDRVQLQQVLLNLLLNAIDACKDLPAEQREIRVHSDLQESGSMNVSVSDNGSGIPPERLSKIFEPFVSTKPGGMGLGLFLVRTIVEAHGGHVWATNEEQGATLRFTLPCAYEPRTLTAGSAGRREERASDQCSYRT
jgi:signal transduction histidine kinase